MKTLYENMALLSAVLGILVMLMFSGFIDYVSRPAFAVGPSREANVRRRGVVLVNLSAEEELAAVRLAKSSLGGDRQAESGKLALLEPELTDDYHIRVQTVEERLRPPEVAPVSCELPSFLPSQKAGPLVRIEQQKEESPGFPREELLKID